MCQNCSKRWEKSRNRAQNRWETVQKGTLNRLKPHLTGITDVNPHLTGITDVKPHPWVLRGTSLTRGSWEAHPSPVGQQGRTYTRGSTGTYIHPWVMRGIHPWVMRGIHPWVLRVWQWYTRGSWESDSGIPVGMRGVSRYIPPG